MRPRQIYGFDADGLTYPQKEGMRFRAARLERVMRLCNYCLVSNRRCPETGRSKHRDRSWKRFRPSRWIAHTWGMLTAVLQLLC